MSQNQSAPASLNELVARIDAALPQTQCTRCGYPDCRSYAQAIASGDAPINQCPPGGAQGIALLASITGHAPQPLSAEYGQETPRQLAIIDEAWCIGCTLCIKACPTDAILGANKYMHTVVAKHCTGCELCIPVCPVDCIQLVNDSGTATGWDAWSPQQADHARNRFAAHQSRLTQSSQRPRQAHASSHPPIAANQPEQKSLETFVDASAPIQASDASTTPAPSAAPADDKKAKIAAILAKARAQRAG